jgi:hypothetical protein
MERSLSTFELSPRQRPYLRLPNGVFRSERNYFDFIVDGESLKDRARYDLVGVLCKEWNPDEREKSVRRLLLEEPADFGNNRRSILVCPECGGLDCGAVSIFIDSLDGKIIWSDFGYQNVYEPEIRGEHLKQLGPFTFDFADYKEKMCRALETLRAPL